MTEEEKTFMKSHLLSVIDSLPEATAGSSVSAVKKFFLETLKIMGKHEFPHNWPEAMNHI